MRQGVLFICISMILFSVSCNNRSKEESLANCKLDSLSGIYNSPFNKYGVSYGSVDIKYKGGRTFYFDIESGHISGCTGQLGGELVLDSNLAGMYLTSNGGNIRFEFYNHNLKIVEQEDCQEHGMRCWFDGEYAKVNEYKP